MPKFNYPQNMDKKDYDKFRRENNICSFKKFSELIKKDDATTIDSINYLEEDLFELIQSPYQTTTGEILQYNLFIIACITSKLKVVNYFLALDDAIKNKLLDSRDKYKNTPLHLAASHNKTDTIDLLKRHGANLNVTNDIGRTPLHAAIINNRTEASLQLLELSANAEAQSRDGNTPLHFAARCENLDIINKLLEKNVAIDSPNDAGQTPLHLAVVNYKNIVINNKNANTETLYRLVSAGANLSHFAKDGKTPISILLQAKPSVASVLWNVSQESRLARASEQANEKIQRLMQLMQELLQLHETVAQRLKELEKQILQLEANPPTVWLQTSGKKVNVKIIENEPSPTTKFFEPPEKIPKPATLLKAESKSEDEAAGIPEVRERFPSNKPTQSTEPKSASEEGGETTAPTHSSSMPSPGM